MGYNPHHEHTSDGSTQTTATILPHHPHQPPTPHPTPSQNPRPLERRHPPHRRLRTNHRRHLRRAPAPTTSKHPPTTPPRVLQRRPQAGTPWCGRVVCFKENPLACTLLASWEAGQSEAWLLVTDLPPERARARWDGMRAWIESGFADLKRRGWQWHKTQMVDGGRAARVWLALAVATLWVVGVGVSCFRLGRLPMLAAQARGEWCALEGLVGGDWLGERSPPV
jgi:hypothetical protein